MLVRTDPDAPKHRGISMLVMDIKTPGLSVNPIIDMGWGHHLNETFWEDVRIPADQIVGEENRGWYVGMTLLDNERSNITGAINLQRQIVDMIQYCSEKDTHKSRIDSYDSVRQEVAERYIESAVMMNFSLRIITIQDAGQVVNVVPDKLFIPILLLPDEILFKDL